jgi:hypothetical protein
MSLVEVPIEHPMYLSPTLAVGADPSGQLLAIIRRIGEPTEKQLELIKRAVALCELDFLEDPFYLKGMWCHKLKYKEQGDGKE